MEIDFCWTVQALYNTSTRVLNIIGLFGVPVMVHPECRYITNLKFHII